MARINLTKNYFIEQCTACPDKWDLYEIADVIQKGKKVTIERSAKCYGLDLKQLPAVIADYQINYDGGEYTLKEYLDRFEQIITEITEILVDFINN